MITRNLLAPLVFTSMMISSHLCHGAKIICDTDASNVTNQLIIAPNDDLYSFATINLEPSFRLSAQYLPSLNKFKLYTYSYSKERYVLISAQEFEITPQMCSRSFGKNLVYSEPYEKELFFQCRYVCQD